MGMGFALRVNRIIGQSDIVLEVVDARFPAETRNATIEDRIRKARKKLIIVLNKSDLVRKEKVEKTKTDIGKEFACVFVSAKDRFGKKKVMEEIGKAARGKRVVVGVIGYPNTGKSSLINLLKGRRAALTSKKAGFTRGEQFVRVSEHFMLVDSPGVIPTEERDEFKLFLLGAKNPQNLEDKELAAIKLVEFLQRELPSALEARYGVSGTGSGEEVLEKIALKRKKLLKGGKADLPATARIVLEEWAKNILWQS